MPAINPGVYKAIFRVRQAYVFDIGGFLMRFYAYMMNIGTVTMLTLSGYSFFIAGLTSSIIAIATFFIAPRVSKLVDEHGQSHVVPFAAALTLCGLIAMLINVSMQGSIWVLFVAALFMGCVPNAQALTRARWTFLIRTGRLGENAPNLRTMFSYEGIIDDVSFMFGPSLSVALAASLFPIAGLLTGGIAFVVGVCILTLSRSTEPEVGWEKALEYADMSEEDAENDPANGANNAENNVDKPAMYDKDIDADTNTDTNAGTDTSTNTNTNTNANVKSDAQERDPKKRPRAIILTSSVVRVLFVLMLCVGGFFGIFDTATVSLAEDVGDPNLASIILVLSAFMSMTMGFIFGMLRLHAPQHRQLAVCAVLIGCSYGTMALINSMTALFVVAIASAMFYAPFIITLNATCERAVPGDRITESLTWVNAGLTCGMAFGPTIAGVVIDGMGTLASFKFGAVFALAIPVIALLCIRIIKRNVRSYTELAQ